MDSWRVMLLCWAEQKCIKRTKDSVLRRQCILSIKVKTRVVNFWNSINWRFELFVKVKCHQKKGLWLQKLVIITRFWHFTSLTFTSIITKHYDPQHGVGNTARPFQTWTFPRRMLQALSLAFKNEQRWWNVAVQSCKTWTFPRQMLQISIQFNSIQFNSIQFNHCRTNN